MDTGKSLGKIISIIYRHNQIYLAQRLRKYNIGAGQISILRTISRQQGVSQEDITQCLTIDKGAVAKSVKKLIETGYLKKEHNSDDKRVFNLYLTDNYLKIEDDIEQILCTLTEELTMDLNETENNFLFKILDKVAVSSIKLAHRGKK